jgi:hypothetical protein
MSTLCAYATSATSTDCTTPTLSQMEQRHYHDDDDFHIAEG